MSVPQLKFGPRLLLLTFSLLQTLNCTGGGRRSESVEIFEFDVDGVGGVGSFFGEHELGAAALLNFEFAI
jgi:hypothetical protein